MAITSTSSSVQQSMVIDVASIVTSLVESKKGPLNRVESEISRRNLSISAMGVFKSKVSTFQSATKALEDSGRYSLLTGSARDDAVKAAFEEYVSSYNDLLSFYRTVSRPRSGSTEIEYQGALLNDWVSRSVMDSIGNYHRTGVRASVSDTFSFFSAGVSLESDGKLSIDYTKLNSALSTNSLANKFAVGVKIGSTDGLMGLTSYLATTLSASGSIETSVYNASTQVSSLENRKSELESQLETMRQSYTRQYAALDAQLAKMQSISTSFNSFFNTFSQNKK